jgi:hypothetical protein
MTDQGKTPPSIKFRDHLIIIDDPDKPPLMDGDKHSERLECVRHWYETEPLPISGKVIMGSWQLPWHKDDLAARLIESVEP